jgi:uncharacterized protein (TIGR04255 family)
MYPKREVFPNSPLALVAAEIRFTDAPRLRQAETLDAIAVAVESFLPVHAQADGGVNIQITNGQPQVLPLTGRVMKNLDSTAAMSIFPDRLSFETTAYTEYSAFRDAVVACAHALVDAGVKPAVQRVGLRYLDEVRVPDARVADARAWNEWIDKRLVDHLQLGPGAAPAVRAEGFVSYDLGNRRGLNFRFAALPIGAVVVTNNLVRRPFVENVPFFVLDFDGYEDFAGPKATLLDRDVVAMSLDAVHGPAGETFQNTITDKARELFRARTP